MTLLNQLTQLLATINVNLTEKQKQQLVTYVKLLVKWNKIYNLTSVHDSYQILIRHIMDSIVVNNQLNGTLFIDVGTGAGLPGIPLAIIRPHSYFVLLDSLGKRICFLKEVQYQLRLQNINVIKSKVEQYEIETGFDGVISRAFASLYKMLILCRHILKPCGHFYALKGIIRDEEKVNLPTGFFIESITKLMIPELNEQRHLIILSMK
ncbi:Ribosomal RNA small subunit methyltransferase G [Candidatus Hartigia pinicola]|nr:Ribosomal RNA small subunit methyltransferase G [Candidatus Hartigia pinicola]